MSGDSPVDPYEVPQFTGSWGELDQRVKALSGASTKIVTEATDVHTTFGGLRSFYRAPEAEQLFAVTEPVKTTAQLIGSDLSVIAGALRTYAQDAQPLAKQLDELRAEAEAFRSGPAADEEWREDADLIDENLDRRNKIAEVWSAFQDAERACHAKIVALVGGTALKTDDGSGGKGMYGYDAEALKQAKSLPWGDAVEESTPGWQVWEHVGDFFTGFFVDGVWGTIVGIGTLAGFNGWDAAGEAWDGLGKLVMGLALATSPVTGQWFMSRSDDELPAWMAESRTAMKETGKALLAWDDWDAHPGRAAGAVTFNVVTTVFTGGAGAAASTAGKAGAVAKALSVAGKVGRAVDPMTYVFKGAGAGISKIGDVMAGLKGMGRIEFPPVPEGTFVLPEGAVRLPDGTFDLPAGATVPDGATRLPDGNVRLPENTPVLPPNTVRLPVEGPPRYMDPDGNIYRPDGTIEHHTTDAPTGANPAAGADNPAVRTPAEQPAFAGVGGRGGDDVIRLGTDFGDDLARTGDTPPTGGIDRTPGGAANNLPGGTAGDNMPTNNLDNGTGPGGRGGDTTPTGGGTDAPTGGGAGDNIGNGFESLTPRHLEEPGDVGRVGDDPRALEGASATLDHTPPGSASSPEEALSPDTHVGENGSVPPPGHGQKLLDQIDPDGGRVTKSGDIITHVDGRPVADYLDELAQQRGAAYRDAKESGAFPRKQAGACVGSVMDLRTGTVIEGINGKADVVIELDKLHPTLRDRLKSIGDPPPHTDDPLGHAEVKAANELLWMRTRQGLPDDASVLAQMRASVDFPYLAHKTTGLPGRPAPFCANCNHMLQGLPSSHGRFTGSPPSDENWIP